MIDPKDRRLLGEMLAWWRQNKASVTAKKKERKYPQMIGGSSTIKTGVYKIQEHYITPSYPFNLFATQTGNTGFDTSAEEVPLPGLSIDATSRRLVRTVPYSTTGQKYGYMLFLQGSMALMVGLTGARFWIEIFKNGNRDPLMADYQSRAEAFTQTNGGRWFNLCMGGVFSTEELWFTIDVEDLEDIVDPEIVQISIAGQLVVYELTTPQLGGIGQMEIEDNFIVG